MRDEVWAILGYIPQIRVAEGREKNIFKESRHLEAEDTDIFDGEGELVDIDSDSSDDSNEDLLR